MGRFAIVLVAMLVAGTAAAQQAGWIADKRTGCRVWNESPVADEYVTWSGPCSGNIANGVGTLQWHQKGKPTDRYEGELRSGRENGRGTYYWTDGASYQGQWQNGLAHGQGTRVSSKGDVFAGHWNNGCFNDGKRRAWVGVTREQCNFK